MICCCCGESTKGKQWFNRDKGFSLCLSCYELIEKKASPEDMESLYGLKGIHCAIN